MKDYYKLLGVKSTSSVAEIKRAYRKKAKKIHPDVSENDASKFHMLTQAYEQLVAMHQGFGFEEANNDEFSRYGFGKKNEKSFSYREWLIERDNEESTCKLIFWDLMHNRENDAVSLFKRMNTENADFRLSRWVTRENFMDYGFILAEELSFRNEFYDAFLLLKQIIVMERSFEYFRLFFPEVMDFTRDIVRFRIEGSVHDELALDAWESALDLGFSNQDNAAILIKMASAYIRMGDMQTANICMQEASKLDTKVYIPKKIKGVIK